MALDRPCAAPAPGMAERPAVSRPTTANKQWFAQLREALLADGHEPRWEAVPDGWATGYQMLPTDATPVRRTAVRWQPDRNQRGFCSFCAADRRPCGCGRNPWQFCPRRITPANWERQ